MSATSLTRSDLQSLAQSRLEDARILIQNNRPECAAYMCGYVVELALKACICRTLGVEDYPLNKYKDLFKVHDFNQLSLLAGTSELISISQNPDVFSNWSIVAPWGVDWRYRLPGTVTVAEAEKIIRALDDAPNGVLTWLKNRW